ncbi:hypothetical protein BC628DRAFT_1418557 [Trametes gibbosa]|nr:hypothetical protein BC628DRAFT_1418557 [Trametes gibbosa]
MLLALEIYVYFFLSVLDLFTHTLPTLGSSLDAFRSLDIFIGVASIFPLFLYTLSLYLLTSTELVPSLPVKFQSLAKYVLITFIPLILILNEVGSFIGISYGKFLAIRYDGAPVRLGVGFSNATTEMFLSTVTLVLLTAFQALNFCIAFYRLVKAFSHQRTLETIDHEKKELEAHLFRGLGWIVVGLKLGAIETVIGFVQGGFDIAFTRRLIRMLAHACLVIGVVKGVDTVEDFQLYSPSESRRRRKSALRAMIQNPRFSTFRHVGGHDFDAENAVAPKRDSVIKLGDPSWMRRDFKHIANEKIEEERATPGLLTARKSSSLIFKLTSRPSLSIRTSSRKSKGSSVRDSTSSFGSSKRRSWPTTNSAIEEDEGENYEDEAEDVVATEFEPVLRPRPAFPRPERERVTVYMRQDRLPILQLRRLSNLEFLDLVTDPFRDPHARARSLPGKFNDPQGQAFGHVSASFTRLPAYMGAPAPGIPPVPVRPAATRESVASRRTRSTSVTTHDRPASVVSQVTARRSSQRDSGVSFQPPVRDSVASYDGFPRDSMMSYDPSARDSMISYNLSARGSMMGYNPRDSTLTYSRPPSTMSFHAIGTPGTAVSFDLPSAASPHFGGLSRKDRGLSSSTTASDVHALTAQFPGIPARQLAPAVRPRSMLSHEVSRTEFVADQAVPMPANATSVTRASSDRRKPVPFADVPEEVEAPSEPSTPKPTYQDLLAKAQVTPTRALSEQEATQSLPTPLSAPHSVAQWPAKRVRSLSAAGKRRPPPLELAAAAVADVQATQAEEQMFSASVGQGGQLVRVKSLGSAPQRSVSASQRSAFARESVQVELGNVLAKGRSIAGPVDGPKRAKAAAEQQLARSAGEAIDVVRLSVFEEV